jgi:hypothetical protein
MATHVAYTRRVHVGSRTLVFRSVRKGPLVRNCQYLQCIRRLLLAHDSALFKASLGLPLSTLPVEGPAKCPYKRVLHWRAFMINQEKQISGESYHVRDCYVWAEIFYLDSATDYREYLPEDSVRPLTPLHAGFVLLDDSGSDRGKLTTSRTPAALVLFSCALLCLVIYLCI